MDLPNVDEAALRIDLEALASLNKTFGGRKTVQSIFHRLTDKTRKLLLLDLASGYSDHGRNLSQQAKAKQCDITIVAVDFQHSTLKIAREATSDDHKIFFVQADARKLPFRNKAADLTFCSLALHHFGEDDARSVLKEMARTGRQGTAVVDLVRSRLASFCIWLLTAVVLRDPMVRHDARLSIKRAFTDGEMKALAEQAGWSNLKQTKHMWFQQAVVARHAT